MKTVTCAYGVFGRRRAETKEETNMKKLLFRRKNLLISHSATGGVFVPGFKEQSRISLSDMILFGNIFLFVVGVAATQVSPLFLWCLLLPVPFVIVALTKRGPRIDSETVIDLDNKLIVDARGYETKFDDILAWRTILFRDVETALDPDGYGVTFETSCAVLEAVTKTPDPLWVERADRELDWTRNVKNNWKARRQGRAVLEGRPVLVGHPCRITECVHPDRLLMAGLALVNKTGIPLYDFHGDGLVIRTPDQLELPLAALLREQDPLLEDPGAPPLGTTINERLGTFKLTWRLDTGCASLLWFVFALICTGPPAFAAWFGEWNLALASSLLPVGCLVPFFWALLEGRTRYLLVDGESIRYHTRWPNEGPQRMRTNALLAIYPYRATRKKSDALVFIAKGRRIICKLPSAALAVWAKQKIERLLIEHGVTDAS
jgi:hypothetical protein